MTTPPGGTDLPADVLQAQLLRYAQDMETLLQQQDRLQEHHQMLLQSIGRDIQTSDLLPSLLLHACGLALVTDLHGQVIQASTALRRVLEPAFGNVVGRSIVEMAAPRMQSSVKGLVDKFYDMGCHPGAVHLRLELEANQGTAAQQYEALVMHMRHADHTGTHWFFQPVAQIQSNALAVQESFLRAIHSDHGVVLTDPYGTIRAVSSGYERMSGYRAVELVGNNPRMLSSGRHGVRFYQDFWIELLESGSWSGTLFNRRKGGEIYLQWQSIKLIENLEGRVVSYMAVTTDLTRDDGDNARLKTLAYHDPLTGLPNRRLLVDNFANALSMAKKEETEISVLFLDLDSFKPINDELGHDVGDLVLQEVASRLKSVLHPEDFVARVGGDEFVILLNGTERAKQAQEVAGQIQKVLRESMRAGTHNVAVGVSIGCARFPEDGQDMMALLNHADDAMYTAKRHSLQFSFYDRTAKQHKAPNLDFDIWRAIELGQLHLNFQPQLSTDASGKLRGCEVLVRWDHPDCGPIAAPTFIPIAEKNGAIVPIGRWVLEQTCVLLADWLRRGLHGFTMSVNVSLRQLRDPQFAPFVRAMLERHQLEQGCLELEFSESDTLLFRNEDTLHLKSLRDLGVRLAIDDFGASFASLARLSSLSISGLKINSQFVQSLEADHDSRAISQSLLAVGNILGIDVIAQGVESANQASLLHSQGCKVMQGFYAGQPVNAEALFALIQKNEAAQ